jgi:hypothetical protein
MGGPVKVVEDFVQDPGKTLTQITQPIEKAVTAGVEDTSKNLTTVLQPVEKAVTAVSQDPKALAAIAFAVAAPYAAAELAPYLSGLGSYAGVAADAITGITIQVAQGVPIEKATENALVNVAVSGATGAVQQQIGKVISSPGVTNAITSTVSSGLATAAKGGSQADVEKAMTAGLAGSTASTIYKEAVDSSGDAISKAIGGATAGAVKGGTEGAVIEGLQSAAGALGSQVAKKPSTTPPTAGMDGGGGDAEVLPGQADFLGGAEPTPAPPVVEPKQGAYLPPATPAAVEPPVEIDANIPRVEVSGVGNVEPPQGAFLPDTVPAESTAIEPAPVAEGYSTSMPDQSPAETARLAEKEQQILDLITPPPATAVPDIPAADPMSQDPAQQAQAAADVPAVEVAPSTGTGLIDTPPVSDTDKQILDLISEAPDQSEAETERLARKEAELAGAEKGAYLPDSGADTKTTTYKPDLFTTTYLSPKTKAAAPVSTLGAALGTTGLTAYRGAGEIEGTGSGKPRKNVWNVESLKLKDALGV